MAKNNGNVTGSDRVVALVQRHGGSMPRTAAFRILAPQLGYRSARLALGMATVLGRVRLSDDDTLHIAEDGA
jgi:hypothetical protein